MKRYLLLSVLFFGFYFSQAQRLLSWSPEFANDNSTLTFTVDCTLGNQGLLNFEGGNSSNVYVHIGVITNLSVDAGNWRYVKFAWGMADPNAHATPLGNNKYQYTITNIRSYLGVPATETILKVTAIFRNAAGNVSIKQVNSNGDDMYIPVYAANQFAVRINLPPSEPRYVPWLVPITAGVGGNINVTGVSSTNATLNLSFNGNTINTATAANTISANPTITAACNQKVILTGNNGSVTAQDSFQFYIPPAVTVAALPAGVQEGINYGADNQSATLVLFAPGKNNVVAFGDFSNWQKNCANQMNKTPDGNYFWITLTGLTSGVEYGFQYLVDNTIIIPDPYTQKILDPNNDPYISAITYPNLKAYPTGLTTGLVSILQINEPAYNWQTTNYTKPDKKNLMVYELLVRDFTAQHSYQALIDSFQYFKNLGINAIELMPVNEFTGNDSWGYNPDFYFAPDKYYGTKNKLKEFIDKCHQNNIAVLLDVVFNQCDNLAPEAQLYWDAANNRPAANNPWLNPTAPHPYSVFNDFNHTSTATQYLVQRSLNFWLDEYKVDGFRFDLAKGFTQTVTNTTTVENYDASRVANLERYYDGTITGHPTAYMILEFLSSQFPSTEEQEYANHGFMLWGNNNAVYNQCTMGYTSNSDISTIVYSDPKKAYSNPAEMGYMESHDEERTMFKNLAYGNLNGAYSVKNLATALAREEAAASVFFTVPGPKMIWQFEERGYDSSINYGGSNLADKPPFWNYMTDPNRVHLYNTYNSLLQLRLGNPAIFNNTTFTYDFYNGGGLVKLFQIADPNASGKKITVVANLDVVQQTKAVTFQTTGNWQNYISNGTGTGINGATASTFNLTAAAQTITLQPGEYHVYMSVLACATAVPTATTPINYCQNATAVPLTATGTGLLWYTAATGGTGSSTAPTPSTTAIGSTTYYVSQAIGCESARLPIVVNVSASTPAPTITTPIAYCQNAIATALTATGTSLLWYATATGGIGSATAPIPLTGTAGNTIYYVSQTQSCGESPRAAITVTINAIPPAPTATTPVIYCQNTIATALTATGTSLLWYSIAAGGTGNATAPVPATTASGNTNYYVSQTTNGCESPRTAIAVTVNVSPIAPIVTTPVTYCQNATAIALTATGTSLLWYTSATGGTGASAAPIPATTIAGNTTYYVSQTNNNNCESPRAAIIVSINALATAPSVTNTVSYCQNATASALTATGSNLLWYTTATGGTGSSIAPTPATSAAGTTNYYVSQTNNCGEGPRASIMVNVTATPGLATGLNATAITTTTATLNWAALPNVFYTVDYQAATATTWINAANAITSGSVNLSNLLLGTTYNWRVSANCNTTPVNNYATAQFTTSTHNSNINDIKNGLGIKISPNPVTGNSGAIVDYIVPGSGTVSISVIDAYGNQMQILFNASQNQGQYSLVLTKQLSNLSKGLYLLRISQNGKSYFTKFLKG